MVIVNNLINYLDQYLNVSLYKDYCHNGWQVQGREEINNIVTGVSANLELLEKAVELKADTVLVHHGIFWKGDNLQLVGPRYKRAKCLIENNINLFAYHLPLDVHKELGNNLSLQKKLDAKNVSYHMAGGTPEQLWMGDIESIFGDELSKKLSKLFDQNPIYIESNKDKKISKIAWCTGGAEDYIELAAALGADAYITGEISERTVHLAKELEINFFAAGHHATEKEGIKNLGEHLAKKFSLQHTYYDVANPI